ncbi:MAG: cytochrome P450 [Acidimicrobiales bacterium]
MGTPNRPEVEDWATDFDHFHPDYNADPYLIWDDIRSSGCPVAHTDRFHGVYLPTRHEDISAIAHDTERFSSRSVLVTDTRVEDLGDFTSPPITSDPPEHQAHRKALLPAFAPKAIDKWIPITQEICRGLLDDLGDATSCDGSDDYAKHIPVLVIAQMIGIPTEDGERFRGWIKDLLEIGPFEVDRARRSTKEIFEYFAEFVEARRDDPREDLITYLLQADMDGKPLEDHQISGGLFLLLLAGIDTTWSTIGSALWHLGHHPEDRRRLAAEPELIDTAVEEFLRFYSPVTMARVVTDEVDVSGETLCPGQRVLLPFPAANRDPEFLADADVFKIDRAVNRHAAFGLGIHRCLGSNLARMEVKVAIEEWMARMPEFELTDPGAVTWSLGQVRGPRTIPLAW